MYYVDSIQEFGSNNLIHRDNFLWLDSGFDAFVTQMSECNLKQGKILKDFKSTVILQLVSNKLCSARTAMV